MNSIKKLSAFLFIALMSQFLCLQITQANPSGGRQGNGQRTGRSGAGGTRRTNASNNRSNRSGNRNNRNNNRTNRNSRNPKIMARGITNPNASKVIGASAIRENNEQQATMAAWLAYCSQNSQTDSRCNNYNDTSQQTTQQSQTPVIIVQ